MARIWAVLALALAVTACANKPPADPKPQDPLEVKVLSFNPDGAAPDQYAALSTKPIDYRAFASWFGEGTTTPTNDEHSEKVEPKPGTTYLAVTDMTKCRTPEDVTVTLNGSDLVVEFTGGTDHPECLRAVGPSAILALRTEQVDNARTVNGKAPLDPAGPGKLENMVELGTKDYSTVPPTELGNTETMTARFANAPKALAALEERVPPGHRGFAFVRSGCAETGAVLLVSFSTLTAELTGGENTACGQRNFFLVTFTIPEKNVPEGAELK
jgi:hypothetical protein